MLLPLLPSVHWTSQSQMEAGVCRQQGRVGLWEPSARQDLILGSSRLGQVLLDTGVPHFIVIYGTSHTLHFFKKLVEGRRQPCIKLVC